MLGLSPLLTVLLAGYLAWPFELPAAIATERALGELQPAWETASAAVTSSARSPPALVAAAHAGDRARHRRGRRAAGRRRPKPRSRQRRLGHRRHRRCALDHEHHSGTLLKLDPRTHEPLAPPIRVGRQPIDVGAREDGVWVANYESGTVVRVDPAANQLTGPIETGRGPVRHRGHTAMRCGSPTRSSGRSPESTRETNKLVGRPVLVGRGPRGVAVGEGAVWVATGEGKGVSRVDPSSRARRAHQIRLGRFCHDVAVAGGSVWVTNPKESTVMRIDPDTNRPAGRADHRAGRPEHDRVRLRLCCGWRARRAT